MKAPSLKKISPDTLKTIKTVSSFVVARTVSAVVVNIAHQNVETFSKSQKASLFIGSYLIGSMVADAAEEHVNAKLDSVAKFYNETVEEIKPELKDPTAPTE